MLGIILLKKVLNLIDEDLLNYEYEFMEYKIIE